jgi:hypothetical protein
LANNPKAVVAALKAQQARDEAIAPQREAWRKVDTLVQTPSQLVDRDPEQEVQGIALPVVAEVIELARSSSATTQWSAQSRESSPQTSLVSPT